MKDLEAAISKFTEGLRRDFSQEIASNPRQFKNKVLRLVRCQIPPRRGRPASPQIEAALVMLRQGKSVRDVLRAQIAGFDQVDTYGRYLAEKALRQALVRRGWRVSGNSNRQNQPVC